MASASRQLEHLRGNAWDGNAVCAHKLDLGLPNRSLTCYRYCHAAHSWSYLSHFPAETLIDLYLLWLQRPERRAYARLTAKESGSAEPSSSYPSSNQIQTDSHQAPADVFSPRLE